LRRSSQSKPSFVWDDPLLLAEQLSEDERMVRDAAYAYAQDKLMPRVTDAFRHERSDPAIFREMGALGLLGATLPAEFGGAALNYVCYGLIAREIERVDSGYRSMMSVQSSLVMYPIHAYGSDAQRQKYRRSSQRRIDKLLAWPSRTTARPRLDGDAPNPHPAAKVSGGQDWISIADRRCLRRLGQNRRRHRRGFISKGMAGCRRRRSKAISACAPRLPAGS
jgi:glutaryl-CoA dehydrogenase